MTGNDLIAGLYRQYNSTTRSAALAEFCRDYWTVEDPERFWPVFLAVYPSCDLTGDYSGDYLNALQNQGPCRSFLSTEEGTFHDSLPNRVMIYRGFQRGGLRGLSWTTDKVIADSFARGHRGTHAAFPMLATVAIPKEAILATFVERGESEVLVDPKGLEGIRWRRLPANAST